MCAELRTAQPPVVWYKSPGRYVVESLNRSINGLANIIQRNALWRLWIASTCFAIGAASRRPALSMTGGGSGVLTMMKVYHDPRFFKNMICFYY